MASKINPNRIFIPKGVLVDKLDKNSLDLRQWLITELINVGVLTKDPCCDVQCSYDLSSATFPSTLTSITIDGTEIDFADDVINDGASIVVLINTTGLGAFTWDSVNSVIIAPKNGHVYGDIVTADDTLTNSCS